MGTVCRPLILYPPMVRMHIKLPYFLGLWLKIHLLGIPLFLFFSSPSLPCLCLPSCLLLKFWTVTYPYLSSVLGSDIGGLPSSSVPSWYSYFLCPLCSIVLLGLILEIKLEVSLIFWVLPLLFLEPSSPA